MTKSKKVAWGVVIPAIVILSLLGGWLWVLASSEPLKNPIAKILPWPLACTAWGCITTQVWGRQVALDQKFAISTDQAAPSEVESLTTAVRRHLIRHAFVVKPVTAADARRYREEILHLKDDALLQESVGITAEEYDQLVIVPFLQQAALQQQRKAETVDELYAGLARERVVLVLPFSLKWDTGSGKAIQR